VLLVLIGLAIVSVPLALSIRTVLRLARTLGGINGATIAAAIDRDPALDLDRLADDLARNARGSIPQRLVDAALHGHDDEPATPLQRKLALAEEVAEIERSVTSDLRVPRVAASLATTGGLLAAALVMREGLGITVPDGVDPVPFYFAVIERGLTLAAVAVFGGIACAALHRAASGERRSRLAEVDALVLALSARLFREDEEGTA
jgi:hypothetical protein